MTLALYCSIMKVPYLLSHQVGFMIFQRYHCLEIYFPPVQQTHSLQTTA